MQGEQKWTNRELDHMFSDIKETLERIENQTSKTNGRVTLIEKILMVSGAVLVTLVVIYFPHLVEVLKILI